MGSEWILGRLAWGGGCGLDSTDSGQGPVVGCCECDDEPSGSCATELVSYRFKFSNYSQLPAKNLGGHKILSSCGKVCWPKDISTRITEHTRET
jgi:hypothetical protein